MVARVRYAGAGCYRLWLPTSAGKTGAGAASSVSGEEPLPDGETKGMLGAFLGALAASPVYRIVVVIVIGVIEGLTRYVWLCPTLSKVVA